MEKKILLLNVDYSALYFITEKRALKLVCKEDKVDIISHWDDIMVFPSGTIRLPAVLRLKNRVPNFSFNSNLTRRAFRKAVIKRDKNICQYCGEVLVAAKITLDHIVPKSFGGGTTFNNCVVACYWCNNEKGNRTPEQADMRLMKKPSVPSFATMHNFIDMREQWHQDWDSFLKI